MREVLVSLCMPTNGVSEWVFPVLDSIYMQNCDDSLYEVVITDNGSNIEFKNKIKDYLKQYSNLIYVETDALPFLNEIEAYKNANGELIKFVNHRTKLLPGTLKKLIDFSKSNINSKPIIYYSNGILKKAKEIFKYNSFDEFVKNLSYYSSWSTGMAMWKSDLKDILNNSLNYNELFPHTNILFFTQNRKEYIINNTIIFDEIPQGKIPKGNYDIFFAFGIEYPSVICDLFRTNSISIETCRYVINQNLYFVTESYFKYFIKKDYCSYDLTGINKMYGIYYKKIDIILTLPKVVFSKILHKIMKTRRK